MLSELRNSYLQAKSIVQIQCLKHLIFDTEGIQPVIKLQNIFETTLGADPTAQPPIQYRINFVKYVIKQWEKYEALTENDADAAEEAISLWYDALESLANSKCQTEPFYRLYDLFHDERPIKIYENEAAFVAEGTTGLVTWEASLELSKWLTSEVQNDDSGLKRINWILELGCGCGFMAIVGIKLFNGLKQYLATDGSFSALDKCQENYVVNFGEKDKAKSASKTMIQFEQIDWGSDIQKFIDLVETNTRLFGTGLLLGADIVFDSSLIPSLVNFLNIFLDKQSQLPLPGHALLSCTVRNEATVNVLRTELGNQKSRKVAETATWSNGIIIEVR